MLRNGWIVSTIVVFAYTALLFKVLPEEIAHHFDLFGQPDAWGSRDGNLSLLLGLIVLINLGVGAMGPFVEKAPLSVINMPWKSYWIETPERKAEMYRRLTGLQYATGCFMNGAILVVLVMLHNANVDTPNALIMSSFPWLILASSVGYIVWLMRYFKPPADAGAAQ